MTGSKVSKLKKVKSELKINDDSSLHYKNINEQYVNIINGSFNLVINKKNNYVNATLLFRNARTKNNNKKKFSHLKETDKYNELIKLASEYLGISEDSVTYTQTNLPNNLKGTYVHPFLITHLASMISLSFSLKVSLWIEEWKTMTSENEKRYLEELEKLEISKNMNREYNIQKDLKKRMKAKSEVETEVGKIDLLTDNEMVEIKDYDNWKAGIGQLISYSFYYPNHSLVLCLFNVDKKRTSHIKKICQRNHIELMIYD